MNIKYLLFKSIKLAETFPSEYIEFTFVWNEEFFMHFLSAYELSNFFFFFSLEENLEWRTNMFLLGFHGETQEIWKHYREYWGGGRSMRVGKRRVLMTRWWWVWWTCIRSLPANVNVKLIILYTVNIYWYRFSVLDAFFIISYDQCLFLRDHL